MVRIEVCSLKRKLKKITNHKPRAEIKAVPVSQIIFEKKAALRKRIWYRALSRVERGILDLTVRYVECIRSSTLATVVTAIMEKLKLATESMVDRLVRTVGFSLAQKISAVAVRLGNHLAARWAEDAGFARYLVVTQMNSGRIT